MSNTLTAVITCPLCGAKTEAVIPEGACQFFWDCPGCGGVLRPKPGDCCVFCSYADWRCPSAPPVKRPSTSSPPTQTLGWRETDYYTQGYQ